MDTSNFNWKDLGLNAIIDGAILLNQWDKTRVEKTRLGIGWGEREVVGIGCKRMQEMERKKEGKYKWYTMSINN